MNVPNDPAAEAVRGFSARLAGTLLSSLDPRLRPADRGRAIAALYRAIRAGIERARGGGT